MNPMTNPANPLSPMSPMNPAQGFWNPGSPHYYTFGPGAQQNRAETQAVESTQSSSSDGDGITAVIVVGTVVIFVALIALMIYLFK